MVDGGGDGEMQSLRLREGAEATLVVTQPGKVRCQADKSALSLSLVQKYKNQKN
jgi:hypothetical protein